MSEIYQIYEVEEYDFPDDKSVIENYLGTWEKISNTIREVRWDYYSYEIEDGDDICKTIEKSGKYSYIFKYTDEYTKSSLKAVRSNQRRGVYYPRIFIPIWNDALSETARFEKTENTLDMINELPYDENNLIKSLEQLLTLINSVNNIFRTIFPCTNNFNTFGFDIRNLLILSCTEFETQFVGILKANNITPQNKHPNTNDYVRLKHILKLSEYEIKFNLYPDLPTFSPFINWNTKKPTDSIEWYANYNAVKHDRDSNFNKGRLIDLINSISACYIMIVAQFGERPIINKLTGNYMSIIKCPKWDVNETYVKPFRGEDWKLENYNIPSHTS